MKHYRVLKTIWHTGLERAGRPRSEYILPPGATCDLEHLRDPDDTTDWRIQMLIDRGAVRPLTDAEEAALLQLIVVPEPIPEASNEDAYTYGDYLSDTRD